MRDELFVRLGFLFAWQNFFMTYKFLNKNQGDTANHVDSGNGKGKKKSHRNNRYLSRKCSNSS